MITFTITFHGPFRVGTGVPAEGLDARVDPTNPLPSTSLKGVMRAAAAESLGLPNGLVSEVFGAPAGHQRAGATGLPASPWIWTDAAFAGLQAPQLVTRIQVEKTGLTKRGALMIGEHVWADIATFEVVQRVGLDPATVERHRLVLCAAARAVTSVGALRRRGEGWVSIVDDQEWDAAARARLVRLASSTEGGAA